MSTAGEILRKHGITPRTKWRDGMISAHEIVAEMGVQEAVAGRIFRQLRESGDFETVVTVHPVTKRTLTALVEKPKTDKARKTK